MDESTETDPLIPEGEGDDDDNDEQTLNPFEPGTATESQAGGESIPMATRKTTTSPCYGEQAETSFIEATRDELRARALEDLRKIFPEATTSVIPSYNREGKLIVELLDGKKKLRSLGRRKAKQKNFSKAKSERRLGLRERVSQNKMSRKYVNWTRR